MSNGLGFPGRAVASKGRRAVVEVLEGRRLLSTTMLTSGFGQGALQVAVDAYGAFGLVPTEKATQFTDFTVGGLGEVTKSYVYFAPAGRYLTSSTSTLTPVNSATTPALPEIDFVEKTPRSVVSQFRLTGTSPTGEAYDYDVQLVQTVSQVGPTTFAGDVVNDILYNGMDPADFDLTGITSGSQTEFIQSYRVTNLLGTTTSLSMTRFFQGPAFVSGLGLLADGGRTLIAQNGLSTFGFTQLQVSGGEFRGAAIRSGALDGVIASRGGLTSDLYGVENGSDPAGDPETAILSPGSGTGGSGLAQASDFTVGGRQTVEFRTSTTFGTGQNARLTAAFADIAIDSVGQVGFSSSIQNYDFPLLTNGSLRPLTVTVNRLGGTRGTLTVNLSVLDSSTTPSGAISITSPTLTFAEGQSTADVSILIDPALVGAEPSKILLALTTPTPLAGVAVPSTVEINVYPQAPVFSLSPAGTSAATYTSTQGDGTEAVTVFRRGLPNGTASVTLRSQLASATYADDIVVNFADGETEKVVNLPIRTTDVGTSPITVNLSLVVAPPSSGLTPVVVAGTGSLQVALRDTLAPTVAELTTNIDRRRITSIVLTFSEALASPGDLTNYLLFQRSGEGASGSARLRLLPLSSISYNAETQSVTVQPRKGLSFNTNYQIQVRPGGALADLAGNTIDQNPGGVANYNGLFAYGTRVTYVDQSGDTVRLKMSAGNLLIVRQSNGDSATLRLFGDASRESVLTGTVTARGQSGGTTPIGTLFNENNVVVSLPESFIADVG